MNFHSKISNVLSAILLAACLAASLPPAAAGSTVDPKLVRGLSWRSIGPAHFSGRVTDVAGVPGDPDVIYVAFASAGLFKSANGGTTFRSIFDSAGTLSIGAIALSPKNPDVLYVGTGEGNPRNSVSFGDGLYKSVDGGLTWKHCGLRNTERFSRIVVDPRNPEIVFAAALGHEWGPNAERGLFRSTDGGSIWKSILFVNDTTGASDVAVDPGDPKIVYCGMYDFLRQPWHFRSGGAGSGLYRSADGGETWTKLTDPKLANGLPSQGLIGRSGVSICRQNPKVVYAMIESQEPGELWRSDDRGRHWMMVSDNPRINNRPFYYSDVRADPVDPNRVYAIAGSLSVSTDGGRTWAGVGGYDSLFGDHHALWIDPTTPRRLINGNDGGLFVSRDGGQAWVFLNNIPSAQANHIGVDMAIPYNVMGGFQDHEIWVGPNEKWNEVGVRGGDWRRLRYMADGMTALADPRDPNIIYFNGHFGDITRVDLRTGEERYIQPYPVGPTGTGAHMDLYRFNWNSPILISPTNPSVIYYAGNVIFKTTNGGFSWHVISPDLTTNDRDKQKISGGPITFDNTKAEWYCTILSISQSPRDPDILWATTDDGNVQLTRNGGKTWTNMAAHIAGLPRQAHISSVTASARDTGKAYISVDQHRLDDFASYVFMTSDFGRTWTTISTGLRGYVHIVKEDPKEPNLLYAGTELGIYASFDGGRDWTDLRLGLPPLPVMDLVVHPRDNDLVIATHARGFYILDDITPLQRLAQARTNGITLFPPPPAYRYIPASDTSTIGDQVFAAPNKPYGAILSYYLPEEVVGQAVKVDILDGTGKLLRSLSGPSRPGLNRVVWDLSEDPRPLLKYFKDTPGFRLQVEGIKVLPGLFLARLTVGGQIREQRFSVKLDPRVKAGPAELSEYDAAVRRMLRMMIDMDEALVRVQKAEPRLTGGDASRVRNALTSARNKIQPPAKDPENLNLRGKLTWLFRQVSNYTGRPTKAQSELIRTLERQLQEVLMEIDAALAAAPPAVKVRPSEYRGWKSLAIDNGLVRLQFVPEIGGRIMQFSLGPDEFFFVNAQLAGRLPPPDRLGPGGTWLNYGGDKLWPAPQGKGGPEEWPGPPDVVLDAGPYECVVPAATETAASVFLKSGKDKRSGIQFSRLVRVEDGSTHVAFEATMTNIDTKPRRWGIWSHTQLDGGKPGGRAFNPLMKAWCPVNSASHFPKGYYVMFGPKENPSFQPEFLPGLLRVEYRYRVGKIGMDSRAGWVASVNGATGAVFVQRFVFESGKDYPDGASVEFWHNGLGTVISGGKERTFKDDPDENPFVFESEMLSPFADLQPGQTYTWHYDWFATNIGGDHPIRSCTNLGVVATSLAATASGGKIRLTGRFGVFQPGTVQAFLQNGEGRPAGTAGPRIAVTPFQPLVLDMLANEVPGTASVSLVLSDASGQSLGVLAVSDLRRK